MRRGPRIRAYGSLLIRNDTSHTPSRGRAFPSSFLLAPTRNRLLQLFVQGAPLVQRRRGGVRGGGRRRRRCISDRSPSPRAPSPPPPFPSASTASGSAASAAAAGFEAEADSGGSPGDAPSRDAGDGPGRSRPLSPRTRASASLPSGVAGGRGRLPPRPPASAGGTRRAGTSAPRLGSRTQP